MLTEVEHEHHHPASESEAGPELDGGSESVSDESVGDAQDDEDVDVDAPRVVQWADSQDEDSEEETDEDTNVLPIKPSQDLRSLEDGTYEFQSLFASTCTRLCVN
jgi:hypothetical protein